MKLKLPQTVTTGDGTVLDFEAARGLNQDAKAKGLDDVLVAVATRPDGTKERAIFKGQELVYVSSSIESIGAKLDMMMVARAIK